MSHDNAPLATDAKLELRRSVLAEFATYLEPPRVIDLFAGLGEMYLGAWHEAESRGGTYVGCDSRKWSAKEPHRRYVVDNTVLLRALDLSAYNVFDLDAYGSPWTQAIIIAARRRWKTGERGALVLTDGSAGQNTYGKISDAQRTLLGGAGRDTAAGPGSSGQVQRACLSALLDRMGVRLERLWHLEATATASGRKGGILVYYSAAVFVGR